MKMLKAVIQSDGGFSALPPVIRIRINNGIIHSCPDFIKLYRTGRQSPNNAQGYFLLVRIVIPLAIRIDHVRRNNIKLPIVNIENIMILYVLICVQAEDIYF